MQNVTQEQGEVILVGVNKIVAAMIALSLPVDDTRRTEEFCNKWAAIAEEGKAALQSVGVPIE